MLWAPDYWDKSRSSYTLCFLFRLLDLWLEIKGEKVRCVWCLRIQEIEAAKNENVIIIPTPAFFLLVITVLFNWEMILERYLKNLLQELLGCDPFFGGSFVFAPLTLLPFASPMFPLSSLQAPAISCRTLYLYSHLAIYQQLYTVSLPTINFFVRDQMESCSFMIANPCW